MSYYIKCPKNTNIYKFALLMKGTLGTFVTYISQESIMEGSIKLPSNHDQWSDFSRLEAHIDESLVPRKVLK